MTDEELTRFALVLNECERLRAMIAEDEAALSNGTSSAGIPIVAAVPPAKDWVLVADMSSAA